MNSYTPSKVYGSAMRSPRRQQHQNDIDDENTFPLSDVKLIERQIQVSAVGEVTLPPDRCRLVVKIVSQKNNVDEAKSSVTRRLEYVLQTLYNHAIKVCTYNIDSDDSVILSIKRQCLFTRPSCS